MRPTCERPTMDNRSNSSKVPVAFANARRSRSRSTPSGRFISKTGSRPKGTLHDSSLNGQQVEFVEGAGGLRKRKAEPLAQYAFGQVHLENRKQAEGHAPRLKPQRHRHRDRACGRSAGTVSKRAAPLAATIEYSRLSGVGPDLDHPVPLPRVLPALGGPRLPPGASAPGPEP